MRMKPGTWMRMGTPGVKAKDGAVVGRDDDARLEAELEDLDADDAAAQADLGVVEVVASPARSTIGVEEAREVVARRPRRRRRSPKR